MTVSGETTLIAGMTQQGRPFAGYGCRGPHYESFHNRLERDAKGVVSPAGLYHVMLPRDDRMLFVGNANEADKLVGRLLSKYGLLFDEDIISQSLRMGQRMPMSISLNGNPCSDVVFAAGIVKPGRDKRDRPEAYAMTANEPFYHPDCRGFSSKELAIVNSDGFAAHMPIRQYDITGNTAPEIANNLFDYLGRDAVSSCAAVFEEDPDLEMAWHMAVRNR